MDTVERTALRVKTSQLGHWQTGLAEQLVKESTKQLETSKEFSFVLLFALVC